MYEYDPIGTIAFFRERHRVETAITHCVLAAVPAGSLLFAPHPQSSSAGAIAWTIVRCLRMCVELLRSSTAALSHEPHPEHSYLLAEFNAWSGLLAEGLLGPAQHDWVADRSVTSYGATILTQPMGQILWFFHFDSIHHRGQLSTYLRPLEAKVPSIYGPSGDEPRPRL
jgi:uncharacterized damage-inducible protein DinB